METQEYKKYQQVSPESSPWSRRERIKMIVWELTWTCLCSWTPKPLNSWRLLWLKAFGCRIEGVPFVHQRAIVQKPWNLILHDKACLGDRATAYSLGMIEIGTRAIIAQEAYLCTGTHDFNDPNLHLVTGNIKVGEDVFVGARAFIMPGVTLGEASIIGACSVVTRDMPERMICAGNPCKPIKKREG